MTAKVGLLVKDNTEEGRVDVETVIVVLNEAELPEFVHEEIHPRTRCANHFRQHLLRYFDRRLLRLAPRAIARRPKPRPKVVSNATAPEVTAEALVR